MHQFLEGVQGLPVAHFLQDPDTLRIVHPPPHQACQQQQGWTGEWADGSSG